MKKLALLFCVVLIAACATVKQETKDFGISFKRAVTDYGDEIAPDTMGATIRSKDYAYVTGRFVGRNEWLRNNAHYNDRYQHGDVVELAWSENPITDNNSGYPIYRINPGHFTLVRFTSGNCSGSEEGRIENEALKVADSYYASFEAEGGKLYYLGDISFQEDCRKLVIDNKINDALRYMNENYPNLKGITPERLAITSGKYFN